MLRILLLLISFELSASESLKKIDKEAERDFYIGPSFKLWCSLTKAGALKAGTKLKLKTGNLIYFPKEIETGHYPSIIANDFLKKKQVDELFVRLKKLCKEDLKKLPRFVNKQMQQWVKNKISLINIRAYDEVLWEFYEERLKQDILGNVCEINRSLNDNNLWIITYKESNKKCL